jgi:hypothetical protein
MYPDRVKILLSIVTLTFFSACATSLPEERHSKYSFPSQKVYLETPTGADANRPYEVLGWVKSRAAFPTLEQEQNNPNLCRNYYNKAARSLVKEMENAGGDAVIKVRSIVMFMDGKFQEYKTPECSDDGAEGEILLRGVAIRFKKEELKTKPPVTVPAGIPATAP